MWRVLDKILEQDQGEWTILPSLKRNFYPVTTMKDTQETSQSSLTYATLSPTAVEKWSSARSGLACVFN